MKRLDREAIYNLIQHPKITKMAIITYIFAVRMAQEKDGIVYIQDFNSNRLYKYMQGKIYDINRSSIYRAVELLRELGFFGDCDFGLYISYMDFGFKKSDKYFKSKGYIKIPQVLTNKIFFDLSLCEIKATLKLLSELDNKDYKEQKYTIKKEKFIEDKEENIKHKLFKMLKVNRIAHLKKIFDNIKGLFQVIILKANKKFTTYKFKLSKISVPVYETEKVQFTYKAKDLKYVKRMASKHGYHCSLEEKKHLTQGLKGFSKKVKEISLMEYIRMVTNDLTIVRDIQAYIHMIARRIKHQLSMA